MIYRFRIKGRLPGMNEFIAADRTNAFVGAKLKASAEKTVMQALKEQMHDIRIIKPVRISYRYVEVNKRRDLDNISGFAHKVIQDSLVKSKILRDDGWGEIAGFEDRFEVDKDNPRIEVTLEEV